MKNRSSGKERTIFTHAEIANIVIAQLLFLQSQDPKKDIQLYVNSPGGSVTAGLAIYDTLQSMKPDVSTTCVGIAASMSALLLAAGTAGKRFALPNSEVLIHQVMGGVEGQAVDIDISARHILKLRDRLNHILARHTGQKLEKIEKDTDRDYYMSATEAKDYGIIDTVLQGKKI